MFFEYFSFARIEKPIADCRAHNACRHRCDQVSALRRVALPGLKECIQRKRCSLFSIFEKREFPFPHNNDNDSDLGNNIVRLYFSKFYKDSVLSRARIFQTFHTCHNSLFDPVGVFRFLRSFFFHTYRDTATYLQKCEQARSDVKISNSSGCSTFMIGNKTSVIRQ